MPRDKVKARLVRVAGIAPNLVNQRKLTTLK
jgi:hypothetical protein